MDEGEKPILIESISFEDAKRDLEKTRIFAQTDLGALKGVDRVERITAPAGAAVSEPGAPANFYCLVLKGATRADRIEADGSRTMISLVHERDGFGEAALLSGKTHLQLLVTATEDSIILRFNGEQFWQILACCPQARTVVLADMAQHLQAYQVEALHREKLVSLCTLAAGCGCHPFYSRRCLENRAFS